MSGTVKKLYVARYNDSGSIYYQKREMLPLRAVNYLIIKILFQ